MSTTNVESPVKASSSGMSLTISLLIMAIVFALIMSLNVFLGDRRDELGKEEVTDKITSLAGEIDKIVQRNSLPGDSHIAGTVQNAPADGQIIDSETNKTYLFSLPALGQSSLLYAEPYITVTGTVNDYTLTYSSEYLSTTVIYESATDSISLGDYER